MHFDGARSLDIPETVTIVEQGQTATKGGENQKVWSDNIVEEFFTFEVAYIGQSYGKDGNWIAIDRLTKNHKTVQKVLSDIQDFARNRSVGFITIDQQTKSVHTRIDTTQGEVDPVAISKSLAARFIALYEPLSQTTVNAAEAALISAFKPRYNILLTNFPQSGAPKLVEELKEQGHTHLNVEIDLQDGFVKLKGPKTGKPSSRHSWTFNLETGDLEGPENIAWANFNTRY